jgi:hypothetical protein
MNREDARLPMGLLSEAPLLPETLEFEFGGVRVAMIHDSGRKKGRHGRMRRRFPEARLIVFGHSHIPWQPDGQAKATGAHVRNREAPLQCVALSRRTREESFAYAWFVHGYSAFVRFAAGRCRGGS